MNSRERWQFPKQSPGDNNFIEGIASPVSALKAGAVGLAMT